MKIFTQLLFFQQTDQFFVRLYFGPLLLFTIFFLLNYLFSFVDIPNELIKLFFILCLICINHLLSFRTFLKKLFFHGLKGNIILHYFFIVVTIKVLFSEDFCHKFIDMPFSNLFLEQTKLIIHGAFSQILILPQPGNDRTEGIFLVMQVLPEIDHLVLKFNHPFTIKPLVFKSHLFFH